MYIYLYVYYTPNKTAIFTVIFKSLDTKESAPVETQKYLIKKYLLTPWFWSMILNVYLCLHKYYDVSHHIPSLKLEVASGRWLVHGHS